MGLHSSFLLLLAPLLVSLLGGGAYAFVVINAGYDEAMRSAEVAANTSAFIAAEALASAASAWDAAEFEVGEGTSVSDGDVNIHPDISELIDVDDSEESEEAASELHIATVSPNSTADATIVRNALDTIFDFALQALAYEIKENKSSEISVPDFNKEFSIRIALIKVHGHFSASGGIVGDLSSLFRDGPVAVHPESSGEKLVLEGAAGLRLVRARFPHYTARAGPIRVSGSLEAQVAPATVRAQLELSLPCTARLRSLTVARVGPLRLRITGLGVLRRLLPMLQRWFEKRIREDVERLVVQRLSELIRRQLRLFSC